MKFSIITPCFNVKNTIKDTIESVIYQRGQFAIEYVIVDGGSEDGTLDIIKEYANKLKRNGLYINCNEVYIILISEKDSGMYDALRKGLEICTGHITAYINADDRYLQGAFELLSDIFSKFHQINWITSQPLVVNEKGQIIRYYKLMRYRQALIKKGFYGTLLNFIMQEGTFWKSDLNNMLDLEKLARYKYAGDYYLWYTFSKKSKLYLLDSFVSSFTKRSGQLSEQKSMYISELKSISEKASIFTKVYALGIVILQIIYSGLPYIIVNKFKRDIIFFDGINWILKET
jgi:glycosyltransferase involved in cell wall biosynthesis